MFGKRGASGTGGEQPPEPPRDGPGVQPPAPPVAPAVIPPAAVSAPPPAAAPPARPPAAGGASGTKRSTGETTSRSRPTTGEGGVRRSENFYDIKSTVFAALIDTIDLSQLARLDTESAREEIRDIVNDIVALKNIVMSIAEQEDLLEDICNDVLGLGPLEPLLARDEISDIMVNGAYRTYIEVGGKVQETNVRFRDNTQLMNIVIFMGSPLDADNDTSQKEIKRAMTHVKGTRTNFWSAGDEWASIKGGIGCYGSNKVYLKMNPNITNVKFYKGAVIKGLKITEGEVDHSDYMLARHMPIFSAYIKEFGEAATAKTVVHVKADVDKLVEAGDWTKVSYYKDTKNVTLESPEMKKYKSQIKAISE
jgi:hypothetical protein